MASRPLSLVEVIGSVGGVPETANPGKRTFRSTAAGRARDLAVSEVINIPERWF